MKSCPTCNRTYPDDSLAFCLMDGAVLSAPYDPEATQRLSHPRNTSPAPTEALKPTVAADEPKAPQLSTIHAPAPQTPALYSEPRRDHAPTRRNAMPLALIGIVTILVVFILGIGWWLYRLSKQNPANNRASSSKSVTENTNQSSKVVTDDANQSQSACGHKLGKVLYDKWIVIGGENGKLGCPIADEVEAPVSPRGTKGRSVQFAGGDGGYLIQHTSGAYSGEVFEVSGCMFKLYASLGGTRSWLGFPINESHGRDQTIFQHFEFGFINWDSKTYQCETEKL